MTTIQPFEIRELDFVGPIGPATKGAQARYIIAGTDYCTKQVEAKAMKNVDAISMPKFIYEHIITRFSCPYGIVSDMGTHFINNVIKTFVAKFLFIHSKSMPYYPQANGQVESTNKFW